MFQPRGKIATAHVTHAQVDDSGWGHAKHDALRKVCILGNDGEVVLLRVGLKPGVGGARAEIQSVHDREAGLQG
jgi:hypothetical protein